MKDNFLSRVEQLLSVNSGFMVLLLSVLILLLLTLTIITMVRLSKLRKRIDRFMGSKSEKHNMEAMLHEYMRMAKTAEKDRQYFHDELDALNNRLAYAIQKIGLVRYNPFQEMGGELSYSLALLDEANCGVVITSIYSREGSYTYGKPIQHLESEIVLSLEEKVALQRAITHYEKNEINHHANANLTASKNQAHELDEY